MVNVVIRAVKIIECISQGLNGVIEISDTLNLNKSTVHRILKSLEEAGMVTQDIYSRKYYLSPSFNNLYAKLQITHQGLISSAFDGMWYLREITGESIALQIRNGLYRTILEEIESRQNHRFALGRDHVAPLYTGSGGIVLMSQINDEELRPLLAGMDLLPLGPGSFKNKEVLFEEIEKTRLSGYAITHSTVHEDTAGISVPINKYVCPVALSVFGPANRIDKALSNIEILKKTGNNISEKVSKLLNKSKGGEFGEA